MVLCIFWSTGLIIRITFALAPVSFSIDLAVVIRNSDKFSRVSIPADSEAIVVTTSTYSRSLILASLGITACKLQLPIETPFKEALVTLGTHNGSSFAGVKSITKRSFRTLACDLWASALVASKTTTALLLRTASADLVEVGIPRFFAKAMPGESSRCPANIIHSKYFDFIILVKPRLGCFNLNFSKRLALRLESDLSI